MNIYNSLERVIDFFVQPFLAVLEKLGIENIDIKIAFSSVEWFSIQLFDLVSLVGSYIILFIFFRFIFRVLRKFVKIITGGMNLWKNGYINQYF